MDLYPWSFDSIHSRSYDDVNSILSILKNFREFWAIAHLRNTLKKTGTSGTPPRVDFISFLFDTIGDWWS
jgi:hypothetical protein